MIDTWLLYLGFAAGLLAIGLYALLTMRNMIKLFIGFEVVSKGVSLALLGTGFAKGNILLAQSLVITFIVVEVSLVATALAIIVNVTRHTQSLDIRNLAKLKG
jgi:multisubunit Na+/H+ antiporter MnhC subunit